MGTQLAGRPCDDAHPFPAPGDAQLDVTDYGADITPSGERWASAAPLWRLAAAHLWSADCLEDHEREVANDPVMFAHLLWTAIRVGLSRGSVGMVEGIALSQVGLGAAMQTVFADGLEASAEAVKTVPMVDRQPAVKELVGLVFNGWMFLSGRVDPGVFDIKGVAINR